MNANLRNFLKKTSSNIGYVLSNSVNSTISVFRMLVLSRVGTAIKSKHYSDLKFNRKCTILANGPSLKDAFANEEVLYKGHDVFVVNMFICSPEFWAIKPRFYFLVDGIWFNSDSEIFKNRVDTLRDELNKVDWEIYLCISSSCLNGGVLNGLTNKRIKILRWNTTSFEGFKRLSHFMFRHNLAMPRCQTVTNMALSAAVNMGYEDVYLYGADHSWTLDLRVNDENEVCYGDRHVYNTRLEVIKKDYSIAVLLRQFATMFESHWKINDYAKSQGVRIWNCTRGSFVDAYNRIRH